MRGRKYLVSFFLRIEMFNCAKTIVFETDFSYRRIEGKSY